VRESEAEQYRKKGAELLVIPEGAVKDIATTRNWILDNRVSDFVVMVDDDMKKVCWMLRRQPTALKPDEITHVLRQAFQLSLDCGSGLWGMNCVGNPKTYSINKPFSFSTVVLGPFFGVLDFSIRYDERFTLKEDYDFFLQHLMKSRKVLRLAWLSYVVDHQKLAGGCQTYRNREKEEAQNKLLQEKWGSKIVKDNYYAKDSINMILKPPL
jgi:hypothetical protein